FPVISFARHDAEVALLQNRIPFVPESHRPAEDLVAIAEARDAILAPAVRFRSRQVVRQERPGVAVFAVVLAHGGPGAIRKVWTPLVPARALVMFAGEAILLYAHWTVTSLAEGGRAR